MKEVMKHKSYETHSHPSVTDGRTSALSASFLSSNYYLEGIAKTFACVRRTQFGNVPDSTSVMDLDQNQSDFTVTGLNNQLILPNRSLEFRGDLD